MTALTVRLPDDKHQRLRALAQSRGTTLNRLIDDMATVMLAEVSACSCTSITRLPCVRVYMLGLRTRSAAPILAPVWA